MCSARDENRYLGLLDAIKLLHIFIKTGRGRDGEVMENNGHGNSKQRMRSNTAFCSYAKLFILH